jgi:hypothetical protein
VGELGTQGGHGTLLAVGNHEEDGRLRGGLICAVDAVKAAALELDDIASLAEAKGGICDCFSLNPNEEKSEQVARVRKNKWALTYLALCNGRQVILELIPLL